MSELSPEVKALLAQQAEMFAKIMSEQARQSDERLEKIVAELKKPSVMEQKQLDAEQAKLKAQQEERKDNSEAFRQKKLQERWDHEHCSHAHPNGSTHCIWIQERSGSGYILCQKNQCKIRPEPRPLKGADEDAIYDTAQFNRLFQSLPSQELFG
jgi:hypothetical protein